MGMGPTDNQLLTNSMAAYAACRFQKDCGMWKIVNKNGKNGFVETNTLPRELAAQDSDSLPSRGTFLLLYGSSGNTSSAVVSRWYWNHQTPQSVVYRISLDMLSYNKKSNHGNLTISYLTQTGETSVKVIPVNNVLRWQTTSLEIPHAIGDPSIRFQVTGNTRDENTVMALDNIKVEVSSDGKLFRPVCFASLTFCRDKKISTPEDMWEGTHCYDRLPEGALCNFEEGLCGWRNVQGRDELDWIRHKNSTPTSNTGPQYDHTTRTTTGHYLYVEMDHGKHLDAAILQSPIFPAPVAAVWDSSSAMHGSCQLIFYYHIYGHRVSSLSVSLVSECGLGFNSTFEILNLSGNANKWKCASVSLTEKIPRNFGAYFIQMKAFRGLTHKGDIAIDDLSLSPECFSQVTTKEKPSNKTPCRKLPTTVKEEKEETATSSMPSSKPGLFVELENGTPLELALCAEQPGTRTDRDIESSEMIKGCCDLQTSVKVK